MQTTDDILFSAHAPDPIPSATTEIVGTPGNALNVYWIVSHFPIGSVVSGPFPQKDSPNVLDDENYVHISWLPTLGALSYDLLFTRELQLPRQPGNFALAFNLTDTEFRDIGQSLSEYDLAGIRYGAPQQEWIFFDNRDRKQPTLRFIPWPIEVSSIIFEDGTSLSTAGAAAGAAPPNRSIQFNNNGAFGGSPDFTFDVNGNVLIGTPSVVNFPPPPPGRVVLSLQGANDAATMEVSRSGPDADGNIIGQFMWLDTTNTGPSNDIGVIRLLLEGLTPGNRGSRMEFYTRQDNSLGLSLPVPQMVIDNTGFVGINTLNPQAQLDVISFTGFHVGAPFTPTGQGVSIVQAGGARGFISGGVYGAYHELDIDAYPLLLCREDQSNGLVGIGLLNPQYRLDVFGQINISVNAGAPGGVGFLSFSNTVLAATDQRVAVIAAQAEPTIDSGQIVFQTASAGVLSENMRIDSAALDVFGDLARFTSSAIGTAVGSNNSPSLTQDSGTFVINSWNQRLEIAGNAFGGFWMQAKVGTSANGIALNPLGGKVWIGTTILDNWDYGLTPLVVRAQAAEPALSTINGSILLRDFGAGYFQLGTSPDGSAWIQNLAGAGPISTFSLLLNPLGGFVGINNGAQAPFAPLDVVMSGLGHLLIRPGFAPLGGTVVSMESVDPANSSFAPMAITATAYIFGGLPGTNPGAGSKELWYDPADGNIVKYAP